MGTPIPPEKILLDPDKWYKARIQIYLPPSGIEACVDPFTQAVFCFLGSELNEFTVNNYACTYNTLVLGGPPFTNSIVEVAGPFVDRPACLLDI